MNYMPDPSISITNTVSLFKSLQNSIRERVFDYELFNKFCDSVKSIEIIEATVK
jgi:hypothetical protein